MLRNISLVKGRESLQMLKEKSSGERENDKGGVQVDVNRLYCRDLQHRIVCHHSCPLQYSLAPFYLLEVVAR